MVSGGEREVGRGEETGRRRGGRGCAEGVERRERYVIAQVVDPDGNSG